MSYASAAGPGGRMRRALLWIIFPLLAAQAPAFAAKPVILSSVPDLTIFEGDQLQIIIKAYDPDGDSIYYVLDQAPTGTVLTDSIITWTSTFLHVGRDTIIYSVRDFPWHTATWDTVLITVLDVGLAGTFTDVSSQRGLDDPGMTTALAWADYNGDSVPDLFVANAGETGTLYLGDSSGAFTAQNTLPYVVGDAGSAAWDDYDHDGRPDLYVVHSGLFGGRVNTLYHNDTSGTFADTTQVSGTGNDGLGKSVSWVDFDCDGDPDIYVVNYGGANELYSNNGNGTFTAMADTAGIADAGDGVAAAWCDYNLDDFPDFYLVNEHGGNRLFRNDGDSSFTDVTTTAGVGHTGNGSTAAWGDYDNDEDFDLFLGNKDSLQVLFSNNGDGTFTRLASTSGIAVRGSARSSLWIDFNMDGWLDLIVAFSDSTNKFFQNLGDSTFINAAPVIGIQELGYWSSVTWADPRNSGVPDICFGRRDGANRYYQGSQQGNYLKVALHGLISSRFGVGARVRVRAGDMVLSRWIDGGSGSMSEPVAHFGLGATPIVDSLSVFWPTGLRRDTVNLQVNKFLVWHETDSIFPVIDSTTVYPHTTSLTGPYTIDTKVTDNDAVAVTLFYSSDRFTPYYTPVAMTDLGSGYFQGDIPGQASGTRIYYYIRAQDTPGHKTYDPFRAKDSLFSFSVDDSVPNVDSITVLDDTGDEAGPYPVAVRAVDNDTLEAVYLVWSISREGALVELDSVRMALTSADSTGFHFAAELAGRQIGTQVNYYARAVDLAGNYKHLPATAPDSTYSFRVSRFTERPFAAFTIERQGVGLSVSDYNLDQVPDVYLSNLDTTDYLFRGSLDTTFLDVSAATLGATIRQSTGGVWGDYNNDRYPDLYIFGLGANVLLSNDRDGTFTDISTSAGVAGAGQTWGAAWVDYDNDGLLDLFTVNKDGSDRLYHNQGDSTFEDRAAQAGLAGQSDGVGCCWGDFDGDGDQDVFVVYYGKDNRLYRNNSGYTFTAVGGVLGAENSVSAAWQDYNNDSYLDLYVVGQNRDNLYRSNGNGSFSAVDMQAAGLGGSQGGFGITWGDFDNDRNPDFYKTRGESGQPDINVLYRGLGDGTFEDYTYESGSNDPGEYRGAAWLDYDLDGRQDLLLNNRSGKLRLYRNIGTWENNHYLRVRLAGTRSNADGIGARVEVTYGGKTRRKDLGTGTGFTAQGEPVLHFGLGTSSSVDTLVVRWPNGIVQTLQDLAADREITVTERDTLYPSIIRHDTIPDQYQVVQPPGLTCSVLNRDSLTLVWVRYRASGVDSFTTRSMVRDSVSAASTVFIGHYHYTMPALPAGSVNSWRIVVSGLRGSTDSTELFQYSVNIDSVGPQVVFIERPDSILP
ncbi:MAG: VCBS repeat-containing protein, partial [Candidatus Glassbacteria bacterium]|nr:VCBS repeat-containing protein [Candidatus Glassbacteria bacterium]